MFDTKALKNLDKDELLGLLGLQTRRTTSDWLVPTVTAFSIGVAVGVGVGLLLAPRDASAAGNAPRARTPGMGNEASAATGMGVERVSGAR